MILILNFSAPAVLPTSTLSSSNQARANFMNRLGNANVGSQWQSNQGRPPPAHTPQPVVEVAPQIPTFNANLRPAPRLPPEHIVTEEDKQTQLVYEQWLKHQNVALNQQLKFYDGEVQTLRKIRKVRQTSIVLGLSKITNLYIVCF